MPRIQPHVQWRFRGANHPWPLMLRRWIRTHSLSSSPCRGWRASRFPCALAAPPPRPTARRRNAGGQATRGSGTRCGPSAAACQGWTRSEPSPSISRTWAGLRPPRSISSSGARADFSWWNARTGRARCRLPRILAPPGRSSPLLVACGNQGRPWPRPISNRTACPACSACAWTRWPACCGPRQKAGGGHRTWPAWKACRASSAATPATHPVPGGLPSRLGWRKPGKWRSAWRGSTRTDR